jgi:hypothetical protein
VEPLKEATPKIAAALAEPPLLALQCLSVVEGNKILFERWMSAHVSRNLDAQNTT